MASVLMRPFYNVSRSDTFTIIPIGDIHIGAAGCDEDLLRETVRYIQSKRNAYWIGMGDYLDCINRSDPRFDVSNLAPWIKLINLADLVQAQLDRFMTIIEPITDRCLAMLTGNHEYTILKYYERDVFREIVSMIKLKAGHPPDYKLGLDYYGWLVLQFYSRSQDKTSRSTRIVFNLHHGFTGGRLKGAKALSMERWLYTHDADVVVFGHSHNADSFNAAVDYIDAGGNPQQHVRKGVFSGTYLSNYDGSGSTYAERSGFLPIPVGGVEIILKPQAHSRRDMIRIMT